MIIFSVSKIFKILNIKYRNSIMRFNSLFICYLLIVMVMMIVINIMNSKKMEYIILVLFILIGF